MKFLILGVLAFCAFSTVFCQEEEGSSENDFKRCSRRPWDRPRGNGSQPQNDGPPENEGPGRRGGPGRFKPLGFFVLFPECQDARTAFKKKKREMKRNREIGNCPEPMDCEECARNDLMNVRNSIGISEACQNQVISFISLTSGERTTE